jgi:hypothetical protein
MYKRNAGLIGPCLIHLKVGAGYHIKRSNMAEGFINGFQVSETENLPMQYPSG